MADLGMDIPNNWDKIASANTSEVMAAEYSETDEKALRFIVAVHRRGIMGERYQIELSTIDPGPEQIRHDYLVDEYESRVEALHDMEDFLVYFSSKLSNKGISRKYLDTEDVQEIIDGFSVSSRFLDIFELLNRVSK